MVPQLLGTSGAMAGQTVSLQPGENTVGREAGNSILLNDQAVSRRHAKITVISGSATVEDLGSSGGTWVNEIQISGPVLLKVGDSIRFGASVFSFMPPAIQAPDLGQRKAREKSRYSEQPAQPAFVAPPVNSGNGCMPDFSNIANDLNGCMGPFLRVLLIVLIILVVLCCIGGAFMGMGLLGAMGAAGSAAGSASAAAGGAGGGGDDGDGGHTQQAQPAQPQPANRPPQQAKPARDEQNNVTIEIVKLRVVYLTRKGFATPQPVVLVSWRNRGKFSVTELSGDIKAFDKSNHPLGVATKQVIYSGPAVVPSELHEDTEADGTVFPADSLDPKPAPGQAPPVIDHVEIDNLMVKVS